MDNSILPMHDSYSYKTFLIAPHLEQITWEMCLYCLTDLHKQPVTSSLFPKITERVGSDLEAFSRESLNHFAAKTSREGPSDTW